jgi:hypothetical protein
MISTFAKQEIAEIKKAIKEIFLMEFIIGSD